MANSRISRRELLGGTLGAAAAFVVVPGYVLGGPGRKAPSDVLTRGTIGTGGMGMGHVSENREGSPPVQLAVCDVDKNHLKNALNRAKEPCEGYTDFRKVIDRKDIDIIHCATPPHWHALVTIAAAQAGKDIYCEKPMTRFIAEGQAVADTIRRYGRIVQHNTYGRGGWERLRKLVASGLLGTPVTVRLGPRTGYTFKLREWSGMKHQDPQPVPDVLDYDMWLGPAPFKPYHQHRVHGSFRGYWDYDGGGLTDMGQHWFDPIQYFLGEDETGPVEIEAYAPWPAHPDAAGLWGRLTMKYEDGTTVIFESGEWGDPEPGDHTFLEGPNGKVFRGGGRDNRTEPEGLFDQLVRFPDPPRLVGFDEAVKTRNPKNGVHPNADEGLRSVSVLHLCNIAIRTGRKLRWDPVAQQFPGDDEANSFVNVPMRAPWHL
jgi:myo-inositol 2-dehydrogenase/D-chiro-inositol 1-dehydrogenase